MTAPVVFGQLYLAPLIGSLMTQHPELSINLSLMDRFVDLVDEGIDLAIRIGTLPDSRLIARRLCTNQRVLVASPSYVQRHGLPTSPADLTVHECIRFTGFTRPNEWRLLGPEGPVAVTVSGRVASNNVDVLTQSAKLGLGITVGATLSVGPALLAGELVRVLPAYTFEPTAVFAVFPSARQLSTKVRAVVDFLGQRWGDPPEWDRCLAGNVPGFNP